MSLGEDVFQGGQIASASLHKLTQILEEFIDFLRNHANLKIFVASTYALRDAKNK